MAWLTRSVSVPSSICRPVVRGSVAVRVATDAEVMITAGAQPESRANRNISGSRGKCFTGIFSAAERRHGAGTCIWSLTAEKKPAHMAGR
ncbi:hypothetical protein RKH34_003401 [Salmonella enterica]|nr:hypothetical protein [Salmonella enterica]